MIFMDTGTPLVLQMEAAECGAACLAMVLAAHGHWITLEEARERCGTSRDGVDAAGLISAARSYELNAVACRREPETLADLPMPQILHWCFNHFVVLEEVGKSHFVILDPAKGRRKVDAKEFGESFTGLTLAFEPTDSFVRAGKPPSVLGALITEAQQSRDALGVSFATGVLGVVPALALAGCTSAFIDYVLGARQSSWVLPLLAILVTIIAVKVGLSLIQKRAVATWKIKIGAVSALRGFWRALSLPLSYFAQRSAGEIISRIRLGSEIGSTVAGPLADVMPQIALAIGYLLILALFDPVIMAVAFVVAMVNLAVLFVMTRALSERTREHQVAEGRAAAVATSGMANIAAYRLLGREQLLLSRWSNAEDEALDAEQRHGRWKALTNLGPVASGLLLSLVALVVGGLRAVNGSLTLGDLVAVQMIVGLLHAPVATLAQSLCQIQEAAGALMRLSDLEAHPQAPAFARTDFPAVLPEAGGHLELKNVTFGYSAGAPLIKGIDLVLEPGRLMAVLGPSGAGKSTLARVAAGMLEAQSGEILLDGAPLSDYPQEVLRSRLVYVTQSPVSFTGTIEENITLWDTDIPQEDVRAAVDAVGLDKALATRPGGIGAKISAGEGGFSGGEMQRMALARAMVRRPHLIVLDETTSALDTVSEEQVLEMLRATGSTVLIVTHRPGTAMRCDEAILVKGGTIVAHGDPADVLSIHTEEEAIAA